MLAHHRQDAEHEPQAPTAAADARVVLAALAHAGTPVHTYTLCQALDWPHPRLKAALDHLRAHPDTAGAWALRRTSAHTYVLGARMDLLTEQQCFVPGVMEALKPGKDESHASTEEVPA